MKKRNNNDIIIANTSRRFSMPPLSAILDNNYYDIVHICNCVKVEGRSKMEDGSGGTKNSKIFSQALTTGSVNLMNSRFAYSTDFGLKNPTAFRILSLLVRNLRRCSRFKFTQMRMGGGISR
jgi:hypothetical protein